MTVISMDDARRDRQSREEGYDGITCACGEAWFTLTGEGAAVCLGPDGAITGYAGTFMCTSCGKVR